MPQPERLQRAELQEITWRGTPPQVVERDRRVFVQFNPETLKVNFANQNQGGDQRGGSATQFVAKGTTKLSFDLWYDVSAPPPQSNNPDRPDVIDDVRRLTAEVVFFMQPNEDLGGAPPGVRFLWGSFLFEGVMDSVNENLEYFSENGKPLRAGISVNLSQQEIQFKFGRQQPSNLGGTPGTEAATQARSGDTVQGIAGRGGRSDDWQQVAQDNDVDNPRHIPTGLPIS